ncbi:unnamed protein product [Lactuca virosa]|uniref:Gnk2-homologous domain-containing protein n=1 Tax=Lactuca virosa TaxID=75947 RepID=A0AAU9PEJ4_9ASTR|nr:unnamed protein product [Lactuca virosa]
MKSIISIAFLLQAIINTVNLVTAQFPAEPVFRCRDTGNYTTRSDYSRNLKVALNTVGNMDTYNGGSFNSSIGVNEAAHVMALCSGISTHWGGNCKDCIHKLTVQLSIKCMDQKEAVMWGSNCMIHFSDRKILGALDDWSRFTLPDNQKGSLVNPPANFDEVMFYFMRRLKMDASRVYC